MIVGRIGFLHCTFGGGRGRWELGNGKETKEIYEAGLKVTTSCNSTGSGSLVPISKLYKNLFKGLDI